MTISYNPFIPQPTDLPSDSQDDMETNFFRLNTVFGVDHIPFGNVIEDATLSSPCVCTSVNHRLVTGNTVTVFNMEGINELEVREDWPINGMAFTVTVIDEDTFSLDATDSTTYPPYLADSGNFNSADLPYGFHTKTLLNSPQVRTPNRAAPRSAYFSQLDENLSQLFFQNGATEEDIVQLTDLSVDVQTANGRGWRTPWGLLINMGRVVAETVAFTTYDFPIPFSSQVFSLTATKGTIRIPSGSGQKSIAAALLSLSQFEIRYTQNTGGDGSAYAFYLAIGI